MKYVLIQLLLIFIIGCSDTSSNSSPNPLIGTWLSNCYERTDNNGAFFAYAISNLNINEISIVSNTVDYSDINCTTPNGNTNALNQNYTLSEEVDTTDGTTAQRITLTSEFDFFGNPTTLIIEAIYRVTGVELNFGDYVNGSTPSLDYSITYVKQ